MDKIFDGILKFMAGICVVLFALATGASLLFVNAGQRLFNAQSYLSALDAQNVYERMPALVAETLTNSAKSGGVPAILKALPNADWELVIRTVVPPEIIKSTTEQAVTSLFDVLNGKSDLAALPLADLKLHLAGPEGLQAVEKLISTQPDCSLEQLAEMTAANLFGGQGKLYLCNPPKSLTGAVGQYIFEPLLQSGLQMTAQSLPDSIALLSSSNSAQAAFIKRVQSIRRLMQFSFLLPLGLLLLVTIFAVRTWRNWLNWWGASLLLGGTFGLIVSGAVDPIVQWTFTTYALPHIPASLPASLTDILRQLINAILMGISAPIAFQSILVLLIGMIMLLATRYHKPNTSPSQPRDRYGETPEDKAPSKPVK